MLNVLLQDTIIDPRKENSNKVLVQRMFNAQISQVTTKHQIVIMLKCQQHHDMHLGNYYADAQNLFEFGYFRINETNVASLTPLNTIVHYDFS